MNSIPQPADTAQSAETERKLAALRRIIGICEDEMATVLARPSASPMTAEQRGPEWMAKYGCTPFCVMDHTAPQGNPGWHQGPTAELMAPAHFSSQLASDPLLPLLSARVNTTNQDAEIFGVRTSLWVDVADDTLELTVAETDQLIEALVEGLPKLRALRARLVEASKGDLPADPEAVARWRATSAEEIRLRRIELGELPAEAHQ